MSINMDNDKNIPIDTDAYYEYYEELASQEELYLEETEEEVAAMLTSYVSSASQNYRSIDSDRELRIARTRFGGKGIHDRPKEQSSHSRESR